MWVTELKCSIENNLRQLAIIKRRCMLQTCSSGVKRQRKEVRITLKLAICRIVLWGWSFLSLKEQNQMELGVWRWNCSSYPSFSEQQLEEASLFSLKQPVASCFRDDSVMYGMLICRGQQHCVPEPLFFGPRPFLFTHTPHFEVRKLWRRWLSSLL